MADGFIVRKGGVAVDITAAPSINFVSKTFDSITFTITNNDVLTADIFWEIGDSTPDANTFSLASGATSSNQVASGLDAEETYTIFAFANAEGKAGSQTTSQVRTTPEDTKIFTAATGGTTAEYDDGGKRYKSHTFTSNGNFVVSTVGDNVDDRNKVDYLIIAGGGSGGGNSTVNLIAAGGGGAGGYRSTITPTPNDVSPDAKVVVTAATFGITIGGGGAGTLGAGNKGGNSEVAFSSTITSEGGGRGGSFNEKNGQNGGSGGGGAGRAAAETNTGGTGISGQGFAGGTGFSSSSSGGNLVAAAGGGGAGAVGTSAASQVGGNGGNGLANLLRTGSNETRAGGGAGSTVSGTAGTGGTGGGANGTNANSPTGNNATVNTGSGGGGSSTTNAGGTTTGGNGAGGIVVIRYEIAPSV